MFFECQDAYNFDKEAVKVSVSFENVCRMCRLLAHDFEDEDCLLEKRCPISWHFPDLAFKHTQRKCDISLTLQNNQETRNNIFAQYYHGF